MTRDVVRILAAVSCLMLALSGCAKSSKKEPAPVDSECSKTDSRRAYAAWLANYRTKGGGEYAIDTDRGKEYHQWEDVYQGRLSYSDWPRVCEAIAGMSESVVFDVACMDWKNRERADCRRLLSKLELILRLRNLQGPPESDWLAEKAEP